MAAPSTPQAQAQPPAYGATPSSSRTPRSRQVSRRTPRRSKSPSPAEAPEGQATIVSSVSNLANTIIGAGALAFPSAFASMGLIPGILSCAFSASTSIFGLYLLSRCATQVGKKPGQETTKASFNEVAKMTFGKGWATRVFDVSCNGTNETHELMIVRNSHQMLRCICIILDYLQGE